MPGKMNLDDIHRHWEQATKQATSKDALSPTSRDSYLAALERENVLKWLRPKHIVLEFGPGDGSHTVEYAKRVRRLSAIDVSDGLVRLAKARLADEGVENADLRVGSVLEAGRIFRGCQFDCIISQRCLINLPEWQMQQDAIVKAHSLLKPGGLLLATEGFQEGLDNLNTVRREAGLEPIQAVSYNRMMSRGDFETFVRNYFDIVDIEHYGLYMFLSRVFHPVAVLPDKPKHDSPLNEAAMRIARLPAAPKLEEFDFDLFYVLRKK